MEQYRKYLENLAQSDKGELFFNENADHAAAVMATIFKNAKKTIRIMAANLCGQVSIKDEYFKELEGFLNRGGELKILLNDYDEKLAKASRIFVLLRLHSFFSPEKIQVKKTTVSFKFQTTNEEAHFAVGDDKMYRLEKDIINFRAIGNFNDKSSCSRLIEQFDQEFNLETLEPVSLALTLR